MKASPKTTHLTICLLGPVQVTLDRKPVSVKSDKAQALLAYVAVEAERPHRRERLAGLFWPESPERSARTNLRRALADLRQAIGDQQIMPPFLHVTRQTIQFNRASDAWVDVMAFTKIVEAAIGHEPAGRTKQPTDQQTIDRLEQAIELYRGRFLEGLSIPDSPAFEEWALLQQERLQREVLAALGFLADLYEKRGQYEGALPYAQRAVDLDPWQEEAQRQLMRLLALSGQRGAALAQYAACQRTLVEDLGVEPQEETTALYEQIKAGEIRPPYIRPHVAPHNLPTALTPFVGREAVLAEIKARMSDPACRLLTLVGPGGIGKTRVAIEAAKELVEAPPGETQFSHGVYFVPLAAVGAVEALVPTIASTLDLSFSSETNAAPDRRDVGGPEVQLLNYLRMKEMLLVLDNFEHLLSPHCPTGVPPSGGERGGADLLTEILKAAPGLKMLVTSREALNLQPEWIYPLEGMDYPSGEEAEAEAARLSLDEYSAVALFAESARRVCPAFSLARDQDAVVRICQLAEGMPLAIELAAAWLRALRPDRIAQEMERGLDILSATWRDLSPRHRSMRAVFDHSWGLLSEGERGVLRRLSVFGGGFRLSAAEFVAGASLPTLAGLVEKSMLRLTSAGRYQMHELLRQYALERLRDEWQEEDKTRHRHSDYYARFIYVRGEALKGPDQQAALAEMEAEAENARMAWDWMTNQGQVERLDKALEGLCLFYERRLRAPEGEAACRLAAEALRPTATEGGLRLLARLLTWQAAFCPPERAALADQLLERSLSLLKRPELAGEDTRREKACALWQRGQKAFASDLGQARKCYEQSLVLFRALEDDWWTARAVERLGWLAAFFGVYDESNRWHEESLAIRRRLGDQRGIAESLRGLGTVMLVQGQSEQSERLLRECIAIWRQLEDRAGIAGGLGQLGPALVAWGKFSEAFAVMEESLAICGDLGLRWGEAWANVWLGLADLDVGKYEQARSQGETVLAFAREFGDHVYIGRSLWLLGHVALAEEAYAKAHKLLEKSVATYREYGLPNELVWALADLAVAARGLGQQSQSRQHVCEALRTAIDVRAVGSLRRILPKTALLLADTGEAERAVEIYALASRYPGVAKSRWFEDVVGRHVVAVADTLPPEVVAAAQERGRTRDLEATAAELLVELGGTADGT